MSRGQAATRLLGGMTGALMLLPAGVAEAETEWRYNWSSSCSWVRAPASCTAEAQADAAGLRAHVAGDTGSNGTAPSAEAIEAYGSADAWTTVDVPAGTSSVRVTLKVTEIESSRVSNRGTVRLRREVRFAIDGRGGAADIPRPGTWTLTLTHTAAEAGPAHVGVDLNTRVAIYSGFNDLHLQTEPLCLRPDCHRLPSDAPPQGAGRVTLAAEVLDLQVIGS